MNYHTATGRCQQLQRPLSRRATCGNFILSPKYFSASVFNIHFGMCVQSHAVLAQFKCWYDSRQQPYLILMPIKVEQQSIEPAIYTFHDILNEEEIEKIKEIAKPLVSILHEEKQSNYIKLYMLCY